MSFIAAAIIGGGALASGIAGAIGSSNAAGDQESAAKNAQGISEQEFNTITSQEQPYLQSGYGAQSLENYLLGISPTTASGVGPEGASTTPQGGAPGLSATSGGIHPGGTSGGDLPPQQPSAAGGFGSLLTPFTADYMKQYSPAYQFQMQQGQQGVLNQDAAGQGALSGASLKDLLSFNQNYANTAFNNAFNQYQTQQGNTYSRLQGVAQLGQNAAANTGQQGTALAGQAAQSATNIGTAQAGGAVGVANALGGAASSASYLPWLLNGAGGNGASANPAGLGVG